MPQSGFNNSVLAKHWRFPYGNLPLNKQDILRTVLTEWFILFSITLNSYDIVNLEQHKVCSLHSSTFVPEHWRI